MYSIYENDYATAFRKGEAQAVYKILKNLCKLSLKDYYKLNKRLISWLSEYEAEELIFRLIKSSEPEIIEEYIKN